MFEAGQGVDYRPVRFYGTEAAKQAGNGIKGRWWDRGLDVPLRSREESRVVARADVSVHD